MSMALLFVILTRNDSFRSYSTNADLHQVHIHNINRCVYIISGGGLIFLSYRNTFTTFYIKIESELFFCKQKLLLLLLLIYLLEFFSFYLSSFLNSGSALCT